MQNGYFVCHSCGKKVKRALEKPPCEALSGWFTVAHWKGPGSVDHYSFCSCVCLKAWADTEIFLKSIEEVKK